jgi:hypothetical protein
MTRHFASLKSMILIATFALLPLAAVNASAQNSAHVNVPFSFVANHHVVPAGYYQVISSDTTLTLIDANSGKARAMLLVRHEYGDAIETQGRLSFQMSGGRHILTEVQFAGSSTHSRLLAQPKQERVAASYSERTGATVELAMN